MSSLLIIPAKAQSTRIPNKNYRPLNGMSLVERAYRVAVSLPEPSMVVITANRLPPLKLALAQWILSTTHEKERMVDVVLDVLNRVAGPREQSVLLLQPTQPLRRVAHLLTALHMLKTSPSVVSVVETRPAQKCYFRVGNRNTLQLATYMEPLERDQDCRPTYTPDGTVYGFQRGWFQEYQRFIGRDQTQSFIIPPEETCCLDTPYDWTSATQRLRALEGDHE